MATMIDIGVGLGGASAPFRRAGWRVIGIDINPACNPDVCADLRALPFRPFHVDLFWLSLPCNEFARAALPWKRGPEPSIDLAQHAWRLFREWHARVWILECSQLSRRWLEPIFGKPVAMTPSHAFWSNRLLLLPKTRPHKACMGPADDRAARRAMIPDEIGAALVGQL